MNSLLIRRTWRNQSISASIIIFSPLTSEQENYSLLEHQRILNSELLPHLNILFLFFFLICRWTHFSTHADFYDAALICIK